MNTLSQDIHSSLNESCNVIRRQIVNIAFDAGGGQHLGGGCLWLSLWSIYMAIC